MITAAFALASPDATAANDGNDAEEENEDAISTETTTHPSQNNNNNNINSHGYYLNTPTDLIYNHNYPMLTEDKESHRDGFRQSNESIRA
jgi:hypothetical protein